MFENFSGCMQGSEDAEINEPDYREG